MRYLPADAVLWRVKDEEEPKVPEQPTIEPERIDTSDPDQIDAFFNQLS